MCWEPRADARHYELRVLTGEGPAATPRVATGTCHEIEAAAGKSARAERKRDRDLQLALQQGQLAYAVRAVLPDGSATPWSEPVAVGAEQEETR